MDKISRLEDARHCLYQGGVLAYPTEAVYGLGCDAFNEQAVLRIIGLKRRPMAQGLILLIAHWSQLYPLIGPVKDAALENVKATWPGPTTWIFPKSSNIPTWLNGNHEGIAIRMSAHPIAKELSIDLALVSTSANIHGQAPARDICALELQFPAGIDGVVLGDLGSESQPSAIYDVLTGACIRPRGSINE